MPQLRDVLLVLEKPPEEIATKLAALHLLHKFGIPTHCKRSGFRTDRERAQCRDDPVASSCTCNPFAEWALFCDRLDGELLQQAIGALEEAWPPLPPLHSNQLSREQFFTTAFTLRCFIEGALRRFDSQHPDARSMWHLADAWRKWNSEVRSHLLREWPPSVLHESGWKIDEVALWPECPNGIWQANVSGIQQQAHREYLMIHDKGLDAVERWLTSPDLPKTLAGMQGDPRRALHAAIAWTDRKRRAVSKASGVLLNELTLIEADIARRLGKGVNAKVEWQMKALALHKDGLPPKQIAEKVGRDRKTVERFLRDQLSSMVNAMEHFHADRKEPDVVPDKPIGGNFIALDGMGREDAAPVVKMGRGRRRPPRT